jgi:hypothetical protein
VIVEMGQCFSTLEVVSVHEIKTKLYPMLKQEIVAELRAIVIPELIARLNETEAELDKIAKNNNVNNV